MCKPLRFLKNQTKKQKQKQKNTVLRQTFFYLFIFFLFFLFIIIIIIIIIISIQLASSQLQPESRLSSIGIDTEANENCRGVYQTDCASNLDCQGDNKDCTQFRCYSTKCIPHTTTPRCIYHRTKQKVMFRFCVIWKKNAWVWLIWNVLFTNILNIFAKIIQNQFDNIGSPS